MNIIGTCSLSTDGEFAPLNEILMFVDGSMELTQCIDVVLSLDDTFEPQLLLNNIFVMTMMFHGESSTLTLGQLLTSEDSCKFWSNASVIAMQFHVF